jgi:transcriptional regulator with XRE-family HTH domain
LRLGISQILILFDVDDGKSGLDIKRRTGLRTLMTDVQRGSAVFSFTMWADGGGFRMPMRMAALADLDRSYLGQIERGENSVAIHPFIRIANALNTTAAELFTDAGL